MVNYMFHFKIMTSKNLKNALATLLLYCLGSSNVFAANLNAYVDNNIVQMGQFIQLSIKLSGKSASGDPDFSVLKQDFDIMGSTSRSSETRIINGQMSSASTWSITIVPKNEGALIIPPIHFAGEKTQPITIVVGKAPSPELADAFFETEVSSESIYVQAQLIFKTRLYIKALDISNVQLDQLRINDAQVIVKGEPAQSQIVKDGIRYFLIEQQYYIFPEKSGELHIPAMHFSAIVNEAGSRFNRFGSQRRIGTQSQTKVIEVKGVPKEYPDNALWLPAEELTLTETLNPNDSIGLGEPVTRTIITQAKGLPSTTLPPAKIENLEGLKIYPDQGTHEDNLNNLSVSGIRKDAFVLVPNRTGKIKLPEYKLTWWDTKNNLLRYATLKSRELHILENDNSGFSPTPSMLDININQNASSASTDPQNVGQSAAGKSLFGEPHEKLLIFLLLMLALLWITSILFFILYIRNLKKNIKHPSSINEKNSEDEKILLKDINQACHNKNIGQLRLALIAWGKKYYEDPKIKGLYELAEYCEDAVLKESLKKIDQALFSEKSADTDIDFNALKQGIDEISKNSKASRDKSFFNKNQGKKLEDLYSVRI